MWGGQHLLLCTPYYMFTAGPCLQSKCIWYWLVVVVKLSYLGGNLPNLPSLQTILGVQNLSENPMQKHTQKDQLEVTMKASWPWHMETATISSQSFLEHSSIDEYGLPITCRRCSYQLAITLLHIWGRCPQRLQWIIFPTCLVAKDTNKMALKIQNSLMALPWAAHAKKPSFQNWMGDTILPGNGTQNCLQP